jgi:hypothetical protein
MNVDYMQSILAEYKVYTRDEVDDDILTHGFPRPSRIDELGGNLFDYI